MGSSKHVFGTFNEEFEFSCDVVLEYHRASRPCSLQVDAKALLRYDFKVQLCRQCPLLRQIHLLIALSYVAQSFEIRWEPPYRERVAASLFTRRRQGMYIKLLSPPFCMRFLCLTSVDHRCEGHGTSVQ